MTFGPIIGQDIVKQAVVALLSQPPADGADAPLLVYYLAQLERVEGLAARTLTSPPAPDSYYPAVDLESWDESMLPSVMVIAEPTGNPERHGDGTYAQWYAVQVGAVVEGDDEPSAQLLAERYGAAMCSALIENGSLGGVAERTVLTASPKVEFVPDTPRTFAQIVLTIETLLDAVVSDETGPPTWANDPYDQPAAPETVQTTGFTVVAEPLT
jgi:hypothetical protein